MPKTTKRPIQKNINPALPVKTRRTIIKKALPVKTTKRPIRVTVSTHGGMIREFKNVGFYIPPNMRVAVYAPPYCTVISYKDNKNLTLTNAHKIYEPGERMPEMHLMLMHTTNNEERFAVKERKWFYHYITANGQPLSTKHFPELKRYETRELYKNPNKIAYRDVSASQFLSMLLNRYGEERMITVKIIACRSDINNEFRVEYSPKKNEINLNSKYWNNDDNHVQVQQNRLIERIKRSGNIENLLFAKKVENKLQKKNTEKNRVIKLLKDIWKNDNIGFRTGYERWRNSRGKRRPN